MSQGELADRRTARGRGPAGTEAHHALLQDEATRNFVSSKTVLTNFRTLFRTATAPRVFRPTELRAGGALRGRSLQRSCRAVCDHRLEIAAVGIDRTRRTREGRNDSHEPKLDAQQNGELIKPTTTVAQTVVAQGQRFPLDRCSCRPIKVAPPGWAFSFSRALKLRGGVSPRSRQGSLDSAS